MLLHDLRSKADRFLNLAAPTFYFREQRAKQPRLRGYLVIAARVEYPAALLRCKFDVLSACCGVFDVGTNLFICRERKPSPVFYTQGFIKKIGAFTADILCSEQGKISLLDCELYAKIRLQEFKKPRIQKGEYICHISQCSLTYKISPA